jgi:hypothetical protein
MQESGVTDAQVFQMLAGTDIALAVCDMSSSRGYWAATFGGAWTGSDPTMTAKIFNKVEAIVRLKNPTKGERELFGTMQHFVSSECKDGFHNDTDHADHMFKCRRPLCVLVGDKMKALPRVSMVADPFTMGVRRLFEKGANDDCAICKDTLCADPKRDTGNIHAFACFHCYHSTCAATWFLREKTCAMCKALVTGTTQ